jgi:hypothetical protein
VSDAGEHVVGSRVHLAEVKRRLTICLLLEPVNYSDHHNSTTGRSLSKKNRRRRPFGLLLVSVISPTHRLLSPTSVGEYLLSCFSSPLTPWMPCTDLRSLDFVFWPASLRNGSKVLGRLTSKVILQFV